MSRLIHIPLIAVVIYCATGATTSPLWQNRRYVAAVAQFGRDGHLTVVTLQNDEIRATRCTDSRCNRKIQHLLADRVDSSEPFLVHSSEVAPLTVLYRERGRDSLAVALCVDDSCSRVDRQLVQIDHSLRPFAVVSRNGGMEIILRRLREPLDLHGQRRQSHIPTLRRAVFCGYKRKRSTSSYRVLGATPTDEGLPMVLPVVAPQGSGTETSNDELRLVQYVDASCTAVRSTVVRRGETDFPRVVRRSDGRPVVVFDDRSSLVLSRCADTACSAFEREQIAGGALLSVAVSGNDDVVVVWLDENGSIRFARCIGGECVQHVTEAADPAAEESTETARARGGVCAAHVDG
jgi:hypothetical protein